MYVSIFLLRKASKGKTSLTVNPSSNSIFAEHYVQRQVCLLLRKGNFVQYVLFVTYCTYVYTKGDESLQRIMLYGQRRKSVVFQKKFRVPFPPSPPRQNHTYCRYSSGVSSTFPFFTKESRTLFFLKLVNMGTKKRRILC